jgi:hypothetical protein
MLSRCFITTVLFDGLLLFLKNATPNRFTYSLNLSEAKKRYVFSFMYVYNIL